MAVCEIPYALLPEIYSARKLQKKALQHARHITMSKVVEKPIVSDTKLLLK